MTEHVYVEQLPDLITPADYKDDPLGKRVRLRIRVSDNGLEILGDAQRPLVLDEILKQLSPADDLCSSCRRPIREMCPTKSR